MIRETEDGILVNFRIVPNSKKNEIIIDNEIIKVKVTAQPIDNKANKALVEYLSKLLKIPKTHIEIVKGETSKEKVVFFSTADTKKKSDIISQLTKS